MKKCPFCGVQVNDDSLFCTECGRPIPQGSVCPHCGTSISDGDTFCQSCGKRVDESPSTDVLDATQKKCPYCGTSVNDDDIFCENCGRNIVDGSVGFTPNEVIPQTYEADESSSKKILPIILGVLAIALIGGGWFGYNKYTAYTAAKQAREKFVADSIEQARKDSIKLAEQKEQERIEAERVVALREQLDSKKVLSLMDHIKDKKYAEECGLEEIYKYEYTSDDEECPESEEVIIYGREIKKGTVSDRGYNVQIISNSDHSCYLKFQCASDCGYTIAFKDNEDANYFFNQVTEKGVFKSQGRYLIPKKKQFKGIRESDDWEYEDIAYEMSEVQFSEGWYIIHFYSY